MIDEYEDDELLIYCSKCAINLVKKGFKVEDLTAEDLIKIRKQQERTSSSNSYFEFGN